MEDTIARYQTEMEELQKSRKEIIRQAKEEAERMLQESTPALKIPSVRLKKLRPKKKDPPGAPGAERFPYFSGNNDFQRTRGKDCRKMEKLKEKQERKKNKKNEPKTAASQTAATPKVMPITVGENVKIKGQTSIGRSWKSMVKMQPSLSEALKLR